MNLLRNKSKKKEVYNINPFSLEDKIRNLFGEVCFYNGNESKGGGMREEMSEFNIRHIKFIDPNNEEQVKAFYGKEISFMKFLQRRRVQQAPFRSIIKEPYKYPH